MLLCITRGKSDQVPGMQKWGSWVTWEEGGKGNKNWLFSRQETWSHGKIVSSSFQGQFGREGERECLRKKKFELGKKGKVPFLTPLLVPISSYSLFTHPSHSSTRTHYRVVEIRICLPCTHVQSLSIISMIFERRCFVKHPVELRIRLPRVKGLCDWKSREVQRGKKGGGRDPYFH